MRAEWRKDYPLLNVLPDSFEESVLAQKEFRKLKEALSKETSIIKVINSLYFLIAYANQDPDATIENFEGLNGTYQIIYNENYKKFPIEIKLKHWPRALVLYQKDILDTREFRNVLIILRDMLGKIRKEVSDPVTFAILIFGLIHDV